MIKSFEALVKEKQSVSIQLGGGEDVQKGFINIDIRPLPEVDIVHDLEVFPWPIPDNTVDLYIASQLVEHINPHKGVFINFMDEAWRTLKVGGQFMISTPYGGSAAYIQDPTHCNPCNEMTWEYFDPFAETSQGMLYLNYRPKPWKIVNSSWYSNGNMEILLEKRPDDISYHETTFENVKGIYRKVK